MGAQGGEQARVPFQSLEPVGGRRVLGRRSLELGCWPGFAAARSSSMSRRWDSGRTSRRKRRQRSIAPGASSWSHSTGVSDSVRPARTPGHPGRGLEHLQQREIAVAIASHSHSSPNGHVPNPST